MNHQDYDIRRDDTRISVKGNVGGKGLRRLCAVLYQGIDQRGFRDIVLDFLDLHRDF